MSTASNNDISAGSLGLALVGQTTSVNSPDQVNAYGRGIKVFINISSITAGSAVVTIQGKDPSGNYYTVLASASLTATGETVLTVYPGTTAAANSVANDVLPRQWRVSVSVTTGPVNMNVSACLIV